MAAFLAVGCHTVDDERIPPVEVYVPFTTEADWITHGVSGACMSKRFVKQLRLPNNYPYNQWSNTGFGGVLLCTDIHGTPIAYDIACPVEVRYDVRLEVDQELQKARCPRCGSIFDIYTNYGYPVGGPAAEDGYAMQVYRVTPGPQGIFRAILP